MASLKATTGTKFTSAQAAQNPNDLMRRVEVDELLAGKASAEQDWSYLDIYDFESGIKNVFPNYVQDSATVTWSETLGVRRASVRVADEGGLSVSEAGLAVVFGTGANDVARGNHTHAQLHAALTLAASQTLAMSLNGQELTADLRFVAEGLSVSDSGVRLVFGGGHNEVARGDHTHEGLHAALTLTASQSLTMSLSGQELSAALRVAANGALLIAESGVSVAFGTGHYQVARGDHTHAGLDQVHAPLTLAASQTLAMSLAGQELTASVRLASGGGLGANESGVRVMLPEGSGLSLNNYGLSVLFGTGANAVARGNHTHAQLHAALTLAPSASLSMSLTGQQLTAGLKIAADGALAVGESGVGVIFGTGHDEAARGDHTHEGLHAAVTVANSNSLTLSLNVQALTGAVRLSNSPSPGEGLLRSTSSGLVVVLGESGTQAARGDHTHSSASDVLGGFMSAADKAKLDSLSNLEVQDTASLQLVYESGVLNGVVRHGAGLDITEAGLVWSPGLEDSSTVRLRYQTNKLKAEILFGAGLMIGESGLQVNPAYITSSNLQLADTAPPTLVVGQVPAVGVSTRAMRADAKPGLPGLATSAAHGFQDMEDKRRWDFSHIGGFNGAVTGIEIDCQRELIYFIGDFTKYGNVGITRIAAVKFNGMLDPLFAPADSFGSRPGHIKLHSSGDILVGGATGKISYRGGSAQWLHRLDRKANPVSGFASPPTIAFSGGDQMLSLAPLSDGTIIAQSWETVRHMTAMGATMTTKNGTANVHHAVADGTAVYLMSRRASVFNSVTNPRAIKKLDYSAGSGAVFSGWTTGAGVGGEANAAYAILSPKGDFLIAANSLTSENGGGSSYAWNGGSPTKHTGLYKIRKDGSEAPDWNIDMVVQTDWPRPLAVDSHGRVYFTGDITSINGTAVTPWRLYRVNANGGGLVEFAGFNGQVHDAKLVGDDHLVVAGAFTQYGILPAARVLFMDADGRATPCIPVCKPTKFEKRSITAASAPTELEMVCGKRFLAVEFDVAAPVYAPYIHKVVVSRDHVSDGESVLMQFDMPGSTEVTIEIYDNVISGLPLLSFAGKSGAVPLFCEIRFEPDTKTWRLMSLGYLADAGGDYVAKAGDTMSGHLTLSGNPVSGLHAVPKQYADLKLALTGGTLSGPLTFSGTTHGGLALVNLTLAERDALAVKPVGCTIWNSTNGRMEVWNGSVWQNFALSTAAYALYKENGAGAELYALGANSVALGAYGQATGEASIVFGSNLYMAANGATGARSFAGAGSSLTASGINSVALGGFTNQSLGSNCVVLGGNGNANYGQNSGMVGGLGNTLAAPQGAIIGGIYNFAFSSDSRCGVVLGGVGAWADQFGEITSANVLNEGALWWQGISAQNSSITITGKTADATPTQIGPHEYRARQAIIFRRPASVWKMRGEIIARTADIVKIWELSFAMKCAGSIAGTVMLGTPTVTPMVEEAGSEDWEVGLTIKGTTGELEITVTGAAATDISWAGVIQILKHWRY
ncbi:MAG TPA: hypothetical protein VGH19_06630 [Verrucomicrobiae bacterium]